MSKGDTANASKHVHGVQPGNAGTVDFPVNARIAGLETRVDSLERRLEAVAPAAKPEVEEPEQSAAVIADEEALANDQKKLAADEAAEREAKASKKTKN